MNPQGDPYQGPPQQHAPVYQPTSEAPNPPQIYNSYPPPTQGYPQSHYPQQPPQNPYPPVHNPNTAYAPTQGYPQPYTSYPQSSTYPPYNGPSISQSNPANFYESVYLGNVPGAQNPHGSMYQANPGSQGSHGGQTSQGGFSSPVQNVMGQVQSPPVSYRQNQAPSSENALPTPVTSFSPPEQKKYVTIEEYNELKEKMERQNADLTEKLDSMMGIVKLLTGRVIKVEIDASVLAQQSTASDNILLESVDLNESTTNEYSNSPSPAIPALSIKPPAPKPMSLPAPLPISTPATKPNPLPEPTLAPTPASNTAPTPAPNTAPKRPVSEVESFLSEQNLKAIREVTGMSDGEIMQIVQIVASEGGDPSSPEQIIEKFFLGNQ